MIKYKTTIFVIYKLIDGCEKLTGVGFAVISDTLESLDLLKKLHLSFGNFLKLSFLIIFRWKYISIIILI